MNEQYFTSLNGYYVKDKEAIHTYDSVAEMKADSKIREGSYVKTRGYYNVNDGGGAEYIIKSTSNNYYEGLNNGLIAELKIDNKTIYANKYGCYADGIHDDTLKLQELIDLSYVNEYSIILAGKYLISDSLKFYSDSNNKNKSMIIKGTNGTEIVFADNTENDKYMIIINEYSTRNRFYNITFNGVDKNKNGIKILGSADSVYNTQDWKNYFEGCRFIYFNQGLYLGSGYTNINDVSKMNYASENMFLHCKFKHCKSFVYVNNVQAYNNVFEQTDFENNHSETSNNPTIKITSGGGLSFYSCSIMNGGSLIEVSYPTDGETYPITQPDDMFKSFISIYSCRLEVFSNFNTSLINIDGGSYKNRSIFNSIFINDLEMYDHTSLSEFPLISTNTHIKCNINGINSNRMASPLLITCNNDNVNTARNSYININNSSRAVIVAPLSNVYTAKPKIVLNNINYANKDDDNFLTIFPNREQNLISNDIYSHTNNSLSISNFQAGGSLLGNKLFILQKDLFLTKLNFFLNSSNRNQGDTLTVGLYIIKNKNLWAGSTLDISTDGILLSSISFYGDEYGIHEEKISYENLSVSTNDIRTGKLSDYSECRYALVFSSTSGNSFNGIASVEYL